jgi:putative ABC transport system permease protein
MSPTTLLRQAARSLRRAPTYTITASLTLVLGIAATVAMFAIINGVVLRQLPYPQADRLVGAWHDMAPLNMTHVQQTAGTYKTYRALSKSIENMGLYQTGRVNVSEAGGVGEPQRLASAWLTATIVPTLRITPQLGRNFTSEEDLPKGPDVVMISNTLWKNRFGGAQSIIGRTLDVSGTTHTIVGVMPAGFSFPEAGTEIWLPRKLDPNELYPGGFNYNGVARLKDGVTVDAAQREFTAILPRMVEISPNFAPGANSAMLLEQAKPQPKLIPMLQDMTGDIAKTLWMVAAAAALVLLVACANVTNLILVRADQRHRELAVREALGAGRARVMLHFLSEGVVLSLIAGVIGTAVAAGAVKVLVASGGVDIPRLNEVSVDGAALGFAAAVSLLVAIVCSIIPALRIGGGHLFTALREGSRGTAGRAQQRVRGALVAAQIAVALVVLSGSGLLIRTFQHLSTVKPGFETENIATFWVSAAGKRYESDNDQERETAIAQFYAQLTDKVRALPGVKAVGVTSRLPLSQNGMDQEPFYPEGDNTYEKKIPPLQLVTTVDGGYFATMGISLLAGRTFDALGRQNSYEAVISRQTAIQFWGDSTGKSVIGKRFRMLPSGPLRTVVGVVASVRDTSLSAPLSQATYVPQVPSTDTDSMARKFGGNVTRTMALVVRTGNDPASIASAVRAAVKELDPSIPTFDTRTMAEVSARSVARLQFTITMLATAAAITLLLGAIGLYGVMAYVVTLRTRELGVRLALGATPGAVAAAMTKQGLVLTLFGIAGGVGVFMLVARFLRSFLFGVAPNDPVSVSAAALMLLVVAALASWIPARRAARVDPAETLRSE